ncbi:MAG: rod shape-determining protein MreB [Oceanospirillaceae bacterium]|nr:rod shape-determining protein MreB [Oceanospirillaceae bacterium]
MIRQLFNRFGTTLYIQIWEKRLKIVDIKTGKVFDEQPLLAIDKNDDKKHVVLGFGNKASSIPSSSKVGVYNPFSHPRVLCSDFLVAEKLLQETIGFVIDRKLYTPAPAVVIHPMEKLEGGITMIEVRVFRELGFGAGARDVVIHIGDELPTEDFSFKKLSERDDF